MRKNILIGKWLVVGVIFLLIGIAAVPTINFTAVKASTDNDLIEITTTACGIKGFGNTTVKLTRQQYQDLEQYLVDFRTRLNQTTTREEAVPIFKEAVVELNTYGLLPKGMSVEKTENLITGEYLSKKMMRALEVAAQKNMISNNTNYFCLTVGQIINAGLITPLFLASLPFTLLFLRVLFGLAHGEFNPYSLLGFFLILGVMAPSFILAIISLSLSYLAPISIILFGITSNCKNLSIFGTSGAFTFNGNGQVELFGYVGLKISFPLGPGQSGYFLLGLSLLVRG